MSSSICSPVLFFFIITALIKPLSTFGQAAKKKVAAIAPFTYSKERVKKADAEDVYREVKVAIVKSERFQMVERDQWGAVAHERNLQKGEAFIQGKTIKQGRSLGAELLVLVHVLNIDRNNANKLPNPIVHLCIVNITTGQVLASEIVSKTGRQQLSIGSMTSKVSDNMNKIYGSGRSSTQGDAVATIGETIEMSKLSSPHAMIDQVYNFLNAYVPAGLKIFKLDEVRSTRVKSFMIKTSDKSLKKGQRIEVIEETMETGIDGTTARVERLVAEAKIGNAAGEVIICTVSSGGEDLYYKYARDNVFLRVKK